MKDKGFSYNTINNHKRSLKASFYIAIQDDCVRKNPFDFKLSEVLENDTKEKVALTEEQEQALLSFIKTDNVYHKYYDDVLILLKTGLRISELCRLTVMDVDFIHEVVIIVVRQIKRCSIKRFNSYCFHSCWMFRSFYPIPFWQFILRTQWLRQINCRSHQGTIQVHNH